MPFDVVFTPDKKQALDAELEAEFEYEYVHAHPNKELVFNHKPTRTLIEADLVFNYPPTEQFSRTGVAPTAGIWTKLFGALTNTTGPALGQRRLIWYALSPNNRSAFNQSVANINRWDFDRMIPCHGDVIDTGAKTVFQKIMEWHLAAHRTS